MQASRLILLPFLLLALLLVACDSPSPESTPQRLPTRAPTPTPTATPFSIPAEAYYEEGVNRWEAGDAEGALQSFSWAIQLAPDLAPAYLARGGIYLAQGQLRQALAEADAALRVDRYSAAACMLRGEALRKLGRPGPALAAFEQALKLNPTLRVETFRSRWLAACAAHDGTRLLALSKEYAGAHPDCPLRPYYQGWALIELNTPDVAVDALIEGIGATPDPPALLWFALGQAYAAEQAWSESVTAFEAARGLVQAGDTSLRVHSDRPVAELFSALGRAYIGAGRCVDAEIVLEYAAEVGAQASAYATPLAEARLCQTPTPTATPYPTATPMIW